MKKRAIGLPSISLALGAFLASSAPAWSAPTIVTPGLTANDGALCRVVNASATRELTVDIRVYDFQAQVVAERLGLTVAPHDTGSSSVDGELVPRHCEVVVHKGGKRNARLTFEDGSRAVVGY